MKERTVTSPPTIYDVATEAGVSISTVSRALNSPGRVGELTRRKVLAAVDALGFIPKPDAVAKARRGVGRVGVIAPCTSYPSVARRLNGILSAIGPRPLEVVLFDQPSAAESESPLLASLPVTGRLDGLIVVSLPLDDAVAARLTTLGLPAVLLDVRRAGFDAVHTDDTAGGRMAAGHLLERGHRGFGFLGEAQLSLRYVSPSQRRLDGYRAALTEAGHPLREQDVRLVRHRARDALAAARDLGLAVPGDVAVVGFDDGELAEVMDLTTIRQPLEDSGRAAMERLIQLLGHRTAPRDVAVELKLIVRRTT